jgi:hypothetical protein
MLRKQLIPSSDRGAAGGQRKSQPTGAKDIPALATVLVTSESSDHPVDNLFDGRDGPGGSRWMASADGEQAVVLAFDAPQTIRAVSLEAEEPHASRTQELCLSLSRDGGQTYRDVLRQEFTFSPGGATFEREDWRVPADGVTHVRVAIRPDKGSAPGRATLTSLTVS